MRREQAAVLLNAFAACVLAADSRPRGVGPDFESFYRPSSKEFKCISSPSVILSYDQVNDDFCDCPDGSDEPGTSACAYISTFSPQDLSLQSSANNALPGFYCENKGHKPSYLPFTNVNDGVCDYDLCCDGSDEAGQGSKSKCENKCKKIGEEWRKQEATRQKAYSTAVKKREELISAASKKRTEIEKEISNLKTEVEAGDIKVKQLTKELEEVERRDKLTGGPDAKAEKLEELIASAKPKYEELQKTIEGVKEQRDTYFERIHELEDILEKFHEEYNPNFNDEGVKRAVRSYEEYKAKEKKEHEEYSTKEFEIDNAINGVNAPDWESFQAGDASAGESASEAASIYNLQAYLPPAARDWVLDRWGDLRSMLIANGILPAPAGGKGKQSRAVRQASQSLDSAKDGVEQQRKKIKEHEEDLNKDYGPDDVFRTLKDSCISLDSGEYTYELCWLKTVTQKSKKGGASQDMGSFSAVEIVEVDEGLPANGKGLGTGKRLAHKYEDGSHCWNGPNRSTTVVLACAESEEVWKVTEEEKCVYRLEVGTPAVCDMPGTEEGSSVKVSGKKVPAASESAGEDADDDIDDDIDHDDDVGHDEL